MYKAVVLPALLYSAETYTLYRGHMRRLEAVQQRHLRRIMNIKPDVRISNIELLRRDGLESVEAVLAATQLRWLGNVARMKESRIPSKFYTESWPKVAAGWEVKNCATTMSQNAT